MVQIAMQRTTQTYVQSSIQKSRIYAEITKRKYQNILWLQLSLFVCSIELE